MNNKSFLYTFLTAFFSLSVLLIQAQDTIPETFPVNGVADKRINCYALIHATVYKTASEKVTNCNIVIRNGTIESVGAGIAIPKDAIVIDCEGKFIYPSFIDIYGDYGMPAQKNSRGNAAFAGFGRGQQFDSDEKGALGWNQAIRSNVDAIDVFASDYTQSSQLRSYGFGTVLSHVHDGIVRGSGVVVTLANKKANLVIVKEKAAAVYSFNKGSSTQSYPSSLMGSIALLRQTYLDARWYKTNPKAEGVNLTLKYFNDDQTLPQIFEANDKWNVLRASRIAKEFGTKYIMKAGGNEYQRMDDMKALHTAFILPLNFPENIDVHDPDDADKVTLGTLKNWELAPLQPGMFSKEGITFALTSADVSSSDKFWENLRTAIRYGLSDTAAFNALTKVPAQLLGVYDKVGSLEQGKLANLLITSGPLFNRNTVVLQNWVQGEAYNVKNDNWYPMQGEYALTIGNTNYRLLIKSSNSASITGSGDSLPVTFQANEKFVKMSFAPQKGGRSYFDLSGLFNKDLLEGDGTDTAGSRIVWSARRTDTVNSNANTGRGRDLPLHLGTVTYPFDGYGWNILPKQKTMLIKNATVWTNEKEGILSGTDVLVRNGKIAEIGKNLSASADTVLNGEGMYLTPGIIDEHSHIAAASINEGAQSVTSEVRIGDNLNPEDISIYRMLAGGVTSAQILHGSANTIGGQCQMIKMRWGQDDEGLKFTETPPTIKFALGENVKRTRAQNNTRFPNTRMGVEQVLADAFQRAKDYDKARSGTDSSKVRQDLELDALVEILHNKRFITCHSYVQSELLAAMRVSQKYGYHYNTFTHVLEGYKIAKEFKDYGVNVSTFSDWWAYKYEVKDAIAYNAAIMQKMGLNVCINSDDAEQARHLNQEAAKTVKYGGVSEEDAFKMVTLNPAKALHIEDKVGSIKVGKDADLVLWTANPLSIYAKAAVTIVDGTIYYDMKRDEQLRENIQSERQRLISKLLVTQTPQSGMGQRPGRR